MNILVAPDKFKGSLTALQAGEVIADALRSSGQNFTVRVLPLADGGDGTLEVFLNQGGEKRLVSVHDPLRRPITTSFALSSDRRTAFIEMACASGLSLLNGTEYDPEQTTSFGTGELVREAVKAGAVNLVLGIGGSATNDAGTGMMEALGMRFLDSKGRPLKGCGANLGRIQTIDDTDLLPALQRVSVTALCDVTNPFYGPSGAARVFAPQKGASPEMVERLDEGLRHLGGLIRKVYGVDLQQVPGSGAGGGLAGGAVAWLRAGLKPGFEVVAEWTRVESMIRWADLVITGEGKVDAQSLKGKVVGGVVNLTRVCGKPTVVVCGQTEGANLWMNVPVYTLSDQVGISRARSEPVDSLRRLIREIVVPDIRQTK
jgi:glycerate kinase